MMSKSCRERPFVGPQRFPPHNGLLAIQLQIGLPHVGADEYDFGNYVLAHGGEESLEGFDGSLFADPEKAGNAAGGKETTDDRAKWGDTGRTQKRGTGGN